MITTTYATSTEERRAEYAERRAERRAERELACWVGRNTDFCHSASLTTLKHSHL